MTPAPPTSSTGSSTPLVLCATLRVMRLCRAIVVFLLASGCWSNWDRRMAANDADGDGFMSAAAGGTDCDDSNAAIHPDAEEVCDGLDNNCNQAVDDEDPLLLLESIPVWYFDGDGDGYGSETAGFIQVCVAPNGYSAKSGDCDETAADIHPGASETIADGVDQDCDGGDRCYADADDDGFRPDSASTVASVDLDCLDSGEADGTAPVGDCDDGDATTFVGAAEVVADGIDQDCDGGDLCFMDGDNDGFRPDSTSTVASADLDCLDSGEADGTVPVGDCDDGDATLNVSCTKSLSSADAKLTGETYDDRAGFSVSAAGDVNNDGYADVLVGASYESTGGAGAGAAYLVMGSSTGITDMGLSSADVKLTGETRSLAGSVASAGDVNGDGYADVLVGAFREDTAGQDAGAAYLIYGSVDGLSDMSLSSADVKFTGESAWDFAGYSIASAGDVNGDGYADILIGANRDDAGFTDAGAAYLILGSDIALSDRSLASANAKLTGEAVDDFAGRSVSSAGDTNGDGLSDVLVGAHLEDTGQSDAGAAYLLLGSSSGISDMSLSSADAKLTGENGGDYAGWSVSTAGDVNNDGYTDVLVGAYGEDTAWSQAGAAYLVLGSSSGISDMSLSSADAKLTGEAGSDAAGRSVSTAGDVNGDGYSDVLVGAPYERTGGSNAGAAYLVLGSSSGITDMSLAMADAKFTGEDWHNVAGASVSTAGDVNGDGYSDILVGAPSSTLADSAAYLIYGF